MVKEKEEEDKIFRLKEEEAKKEVKNIFNRDDWRELNVGYTYTHIL